MQNLMKTYREDCRIQGMDKTCGGKTKSFTGKIKLWLKCRLLSLAGRFRVTSAMRRRSLEKQGWKPLPIDMNRYV